jgi:hypothetical protein
MPTKGFHFWIINLWKTINGNQRKFDLFSIDNKSFYHDYWIIIIVFNFEFNLEYIY